jgi:hypothetical protein
MLPIQGPPYFLVQVFQPQPVLVRDVAEDTVHGLGFAVAFFALDDVVGGDAALGKVDVACVGVWVCVSGWM